MNNLRLRLTFQNYFFKLDLSDIAIDPQVIQSEMTYDLSENLPSPLVDPTVIPVEIDIPDSENPLINTILESCSDFIPDNEQNLSIPVDLSSVPDPIALATQEISEPIVVEVPLDIDMDAIQRMKWFDSLSAGKQHTDFFANRVTNYSKGAQKWDANALF